jgi:hypothetical protein
MAVQVTPRNIAYRADANSDGVPVIITVTFDCEWPNGQTLSGLTADIPIGPQTVGKTQQEIIEFAWKAVKPAVVAADAQLKDKPARLIGRPWTPPVADRV